MGIYPEKTILWEDTCTPAFTVALFTVAKTWKQFKFPSTDKWIKKMRYPYTMDYYSAIKKDEIMPFAVTWMDLKSVILNEVRQRRSEVKLLSRIRLFVWTVAYQAPLSMGFSR